MQSMSSDFRVAYVGKTHIVLACITFELHPDTSLATQSDRLIMTIAFKKKKVKVSSLVIDVYVINETLNL